MFIVIAFAVMFILCYVLHRMRKRRAFVSLNWPTNLTESRMVENVRSYFKEHGWTIHIRNSSEVQSVVGRNDIWFAVHCIPASSPFTNTLILDLANLKIVHEPNVLIAMCEATPPLSLIKQARDRQVNLTSYRSLRDITSWNVASDVSFDALAVILQQPEKDLKGISFLYDEATIR